MPSNWNITLNNYLKGGFGSSTRTFRVPKLYKKYYTEIIDDVEVYNEEQAFNELATLIKQNIIHRYKDLFLVADLYSTRWFGNIMVYPTRFDGIMFTYDPNKVKYPVFLTTLNNPTNAYSVDAIFTQLNNAKFNIPSGSCRIPSASVEMPYGYGLECSSNQINSILKANQITKENPLEDNWVSLHAENIEELNPATPFLVYKPHTIKYIQQAIYKAMEFVSLNREIWQIIKDTSFSGGNYSFNDQSSRRILTTDLLGIDANTLLENAELNRYNVYTDCDGTKSIYFKDELIYSGNKLDWEMDYLFPDTNVEVDNKFIIEAEGQYEPPL